MKPAPGAPDEVLDYYNAVIARLESEQQIRELEAGSGKNSIRSGNQAAVIEAVEMLSGDQSSRQVGDPVRFQVDIAVNEDLDELTVGLLILGIGWVMMCSAPIPGIWAPAANNSVSMNIVG